MNRISLFLSLLALPVVVAGCGDDDIMRLDAGEPNPVVDGGFVCFRETSTACLGNAWNTCIRSGEFLEAQREECGADGRICVEDLGCAICRPDMISCVENDVVQCNATGDEFEVLETCNLEEGSVCRDGRCQNLCEVAVNDKSYVGCEFFSADLDNAALGSGRDASSQQYAVVVSNPSGLPPQTIVDGYTTDVIIEVNDAPYGEEPVIREVMRETLGPGDLEVFALPRREVDGSSSNLLCAPGEDEICASGETCRCASAGRPPCFCQNGNPGAGLNDGTHTSLSSQAYRVRSTLPIIAYQFNPLDNVGVFSNDASLLLPTSATSPTYTVVGWPQTIADADCDPAEPACRDIDFNPSVDDEDLRAFLTIVGAVEGTTVNLTMGDRVVRVLPFGDTIPLMGSGDELTVELGPFDVLNLETDGLNGDFTGTRIEATNPVSVFVGSEASDAPRFETYATRQCCADHLEEQLFGDETLGSTFMIARMPPRTEALNVAFLDPTVDSVAEVNEPEWVRVVAVAPGETVVTTTLPPPDDRVTLSQGEAFIYRADQDFLMTAEGGKPIAVLQTLPSQQAIGVPSQYPGGDPAIVAIPPVEQYRQNYVFLTPDKYAFDFLVLTADRDTQILLDGAPLESFSCVTSPADGRERLPGDPPPDQVIHRCQLSFPDVGTPCDPETDPDCDPSMGVGGGRGRGNVFDGMQNDGVHTIVATDPVGMVVYGFDAFVSYAYAAGLNLKPIPR